MKFMFRWVLNELREINRKLDILVRHSAPDFSAEDRSLKEETQDVQEAKDRIPRNEQGGK